MDTYVIIAREMGDAIHRRSYEDSLILAASEADATVVVTPHLYHIPENSEIWHTLAALRGHVLLFSWLHSRPMEWLVRRHAFAADELSVFDLSSFASPDKAMDEVRKYIVKSSAGSVEYLTSTTEPRWYPIVDYSRCTSCGHCLQFCIFGTYELDATGRVIAVNPDNCKPGCPACARICPNSAIMFALHQDDPAIAGAPGCYVTPDTAARKMYYLRTGAECPVCGMAGEWQAEDGPSCSECGRPLGGSLQKSNAQNETSATLDEIDALIDELDHLADRRD